MTTPNRRENPRQSPVVVEAVPLPTPRMNLHNLEALRREMGRVYRDMRGGKLKTQDGARLVYVLGEMRKLFEAVELERRIQALEVGNPAMTIDADHEARANTIINRLEGGTDDDGT